MTLYGYFVDKQSCSLLWKYVYQRLYFVTTVVHECTLLFRTILVKYCNTSKAKFLALHFIFSHKQIINIFKTLPVNCEEIWPFDIRKFNVEGNKKLWTVFMWFTHWLCDYRNYIRIPEKMEMF
jgi:hypothetical protein